MGVDVTVGILCYLAHRHQANDVDTLAHFCVVNDVLRSRGFPEHVEPMALPSEVESQWDHPRAGSSSFALLRRFYTSWVIEGRPPNPGHDVGEFAAIGRLSKASFDRHHLLTGPDSEGYYVPVDFPEVLEDARVEGG